MIDFLQQQLEKSGGRLEANVLSEGQKKATKRTIIAVDPVGIVIDAKGTWYSVTWRKIVNIHGAFDQPDIPPA